jgi:hypothetical protein
VVAAVGLGGASEVVASGVVWRVGTTGCSSASVARPPAGGFCFDTITNALADSRVLDGDTILVKGSGDASNPLAYNECIDITKRLNVVAGGDVMIVGNFLADICGSFSPTVTISGSRVRFQGFVVNKQGVNPTASEILITGNSNVVAANRIPDLGSGSSGDREGIVLAGGAQGNLVIANVIVGADVGSGIRIAADAGSLNQVLHNVSARNQDDGISIQASKTVVEGNVTMANADDGIGIDCGKLKGTALTKNVSAQNGDGDSTDFDIQLHPGSQRPVLKSNIYQTSGVVAENSCD